MIILTEIWTCLWPALRRYNPILLGSSVIIRKRHVRGTLIKLIKEMFGIGAYMCLLCHKLEAKGTSESFMHDS